jgi:hypothetical protein
VLEPASVRTGTRSESMSSTVLYMSMSLDGFITGPNAGPDNGLGDGGDRLHEWVFPGVEGGDFDGAVRRLRGVNRGRRPWDVRTRRWLGR